MLFTLTYVQKGPFLSFYYAVLFLWYLYILEALQIILSQDVLFLHGVCQWSVIYEGIGLLLILSTF